MQSTSSRTWGTVIFAAGLILALVLALAAIWGDFEALSYFYTGATYGPFGGLRCPVLMTRADTAQISATFDNPGSKTIEPYYQVRISGPLGRGFEKQLTLAPHASATVHWTLSAADIDLGWFVITKVTVLPFAGDPTREATCGMLVLDLGGLKSTLLLPLAVILSLAGILFGLTLREGTEEPPPGRESTLRNGMRATGLAALLAMLTGFLGWWLIGLIFSAIAILLAAILFRIGTSS